MGCLHPAALRPARSPADGNGSPAGHPPAVQHEDGGCITVVAGSALQLGHRPQQLAASGHGCRGPLGLQEGIGCAADCRTSEQARGVLQQGCCSAREPCSHGGTPLQKHCQPARARGQGGGGACGDTLLCGSVSLSLLEASSRFLLALPPRLLGRWVRFAPWLGGAAPSAYCCSRARRRLLRQ